MKRTSVIAAGAAAAALAALTACASTAVKATAPPTIFTPSAAPPPATTPPPAPVTSGPAGTSFTVTTQDDSGASVSYTVTLVKVDQEAALAAYTELAAPGDHMAAAEFRITGVTGQVSDDANNDAGAVGTDTTEYPYSDNAVTDGPNFSYGEFAVSAGQTVSGWVSFELPAGQQVASVQWTPNIFEGSHATWTV